MVSLNQFMHSLIKLVGFCVNMEDNNETNKGSQLKLSQPKQLSLLPVN